MEPRVDKYDSLEDFLRDIDTIDKRWIDSSGEGPTFWSGGLDFAGAVKTAREGFDLDKISATLDTIPFTGNKNFLPENGVSGAVVDMAAYLEGQPENMIDFPYQDDVHFLDLVVDIGELADVGSNVFMNKAVATALLVNDLEGHGYRVAVWIAEFNRHHNAPDSTFWNGSRQWYNHVLVNVKKHREALSIGQLAGCMHPSFFRKIMFRHIEFIWGNKYDQSVPVGYGQNIDSLKEVDWLKANVFENEPVFLPNSKLQQIYGVNFDLTKLEGAREWAYFYASEHITKKEPV